LLRERERERERERRRERQTETKREEADKKTNLGFCPPSWRQC
jgi:hypothetical protein